MISICNTEILCYNIVLVFLPGGLGKPGKSMPKRGSVNRKIPEADIRLVYGMIDRKDNDMSEKQKKSEEVGKKSVFKANLVIMLTVLLLFGGIILFTGVLGDYFGKTTENIALCIIAGILAVLLYKSKRS